MNMAKLHLCINETKVDLTAVARVAEVMATLTRDLIVATHKLVAVVSKKLVPLVMQMPERVRKVLVGVRATAYWISQTLKRSRPPDGFNLEGARSMILKGEPPPESWCRWITTLSFSETKLEDLSPLAKLTCLEQLYLTGTRVRNLAPLAGLTNLRKLNLGGTKILDLSPLSNLIRLEGLDISNTDVADVSCLHGLRKLSGLNLTATYVSDLSAVSHVELVVPSTGRQVVGTGDQSPSTPKFSSYEVTVSKKPGNKDRKPA
jgi:hypothetical protein